MHVYVCMYVCHLEKSAGIATYRYTVTVSLDSAGFNSALGSWSGWLGFVLIWLGWY